MPPRRVKIKGLPASRPSALSPLPRSASLTAASSPVVSAFLGALCRYHRLLLVLLLLALSNIAGYYYPVLWSPARRATLLATRATLLSHWWANASHPSQASLQSLHSLQALPSLGKEEGYELRRIIASDEALGEAGRTGGRAGGRGGVGGRGGGRGGGGEGGGERGRGEGGEGGGGRGGGTRFIRAKDSQHVRDIPVTVYKKGSRIGKKDTAGGEAARSPLQRQGEGEEGIQGNEGQGGEKLGGLETNRGEGRGEGEGERGGGGSGEGRTGEEGGGRADEAVHVEHWDWQREYLEDVAIRVSQEKLCRGIFPRGVAAEEDDKRYAGDCLGGYCKNTGCPKRSCAAGYWRCNRGGGEKVPEGGCLGGCLGRGLCRGIFPRGVAVGEEDDKSYCRASHQATTCDHHKLFHLLLSPCATSLSSCPSPSNPLFSPTPPAPNQQPPRLPRGPPLPPYPPRLPQPGQQPAVPRISPVLGPPSPPVSTRTPPPNSTQPITRLAHLSRPALRSLVFLARHGLGNSLRARTPLRATASHPARGERLEGVSPLSVRLCHASHLFVFHPLPQHTSSQPITRLSHLSRPSLRSLVFLARHGLGNSQRGFVSAFVFARLSGRRLVTLHAGEHHKVQPISRLAHLSRPALRSLVFLARHGLGNSLRGFVSAFVFARLSGRRLVTLHAGEHHKVYDLLCHAFHCGFDGPKYLMESIKSIPAMRNALASTHPILGARTGSHFDLFWHRNDTLKSCVYAAFKCRTPPRPPFSQFSMVRSFPGHVRIHRPKRTFQEASHHHLRHPPQIHPS
ncbi:unnamed protein product [Closterium sp. Yama58-4]|nr:unnamed protein product [Closterium sp. Yama58-4]